MNTTTTLLTPSEAAGYLGLTPHEFHHLKVTGTGPDWTQLTARTIRYDVDDLDTWKRNQDTPLPGL